MRCAWVKIDVDRLSLRLRASTGRSLNDWELQQWLQDHGFNWAGGPWYSCPGGGEGLMPEEILEKQTRETIDGVTFVDRDVSRPPQRPSP